ncbi:MAG: anthranilate phosphoribosyltransferase [Planctomycetota bacterium]
MPSAMRDAPKRPIERLLTGLDLTIEESEQLFTALVEGALTEIQTTALLCTLRTKGETPPEIAGAVRAFHTAANPFPRPCGVLADTCGTGGAGRNTVNISTAAAFVVAAMGIPVAKHGNRSVSSRCGSADLLEAVGGRIEMSSDLSRQTLDTTGLCYLHAPQYHPGIRHAMPVRRALRTRTIFNLLGPLLNPARPSVQLVGAYDRSLVRPLAETLKILGCASALVVHGDGLDEIALHGPTTAVELRNGRITELVLTPEDCGVSRFPIEALAGGEPEENARWLNELLGGGATEAHQSAVAVNAGAVAWLAGHSACISEGTEEARDVLRSGSALQRLEMYVEATHDAR